MNGGLFTALLCSLAGAYEWSADDPRFDDDGPGTYVYPSGPAYRRGQLDLRGFALVADGERVRLTLRFDQPVTPRAGAGFHPRRGAAPTGLELQHLDVYFDRGPGGFTDALPGRRVRFSPDEAWDVAVVLTPRPAELRSALEGLPYGAAVIVPDRVRVEGPKVEVELPAHALGGAPDATWGVQVLVTGARLEGSFRAFERLTGGAVIDLFVMPVHTVPEAEAFGGGELGGAHPQVIDLLMPDGLAQAAALSSYGRDPVRFAEVPMIGPGRPRPAAVEPAPAPLARPAAVAPVALGEARVESVDGELVVIARPAAPVKRLAIGTVLGPEGEAIARVVLTSEFPTFLLATAIEGREHIRPGARVRFPPAEDKEKDHGDR